jgi:hypothetical protein
MSTAAWLLGIAMIWLGFNLGLCVANEAWLALVIILPVNLVVIFMIGHWSRKGRL